MRVWRKAAILQVEGSERLRTSLAAAEHGFELKGKRILRAPVAGLQAAMDEEPDAIVAGSIGFVRKGLGLVGAEVPELPDYPRSLAPFLGRTIRRGTLEEALRHEDGRWFVKPAALTKLFTGFVVDGTRSTFEASGLPMDTPVLIAEAVRFASEWRCYVVEHEIARAGNYRGDPLIFPDAARIRAMLATMIEASEAPISFVIDVGVTEGGETLLVEVNDGYAVGNYALPPLEYAHLLETRWDQMTLTAATA